MTARSPRIGDVVLQDKYGIRLTLAAFPDKVGSPPGFAYEAGAELTASDEAAWSAETLRMGVRGFRLAHDKRAPSAAELEELVVASRLRPMERYIPREAYRAALAAKGAALTEAELEALRVTKPRTMRLTGVTADLRWDDGLAAWRPERRIEQVELEQRDRRRATTKEG